MHLKIMIVVQIIFSMLSIIFKHLYHSASYLQNTETLVLNMRLSVA